MRSVLIVLATSGTPEAAMDFAVEKARELGARLVALYVVETELQKEIFDRFSDIGFIGDRPSSELGEALMKEHRQRGYEELGRAQIKCMEAAVDFEPVTEVGDYVQSALKAIETYGAELAVAVRRRPGLFSRYFSLSHAEELKQRAPCEVALFDA